MQLIRNIFNKCLYFITHTQYSLIIYFFDYISADIYGSCIYKNNILRTYIEMIYERYIPHKLYIKVDDLVDGLPFIEHSSIYQGYKRYVHNVTFIQYISQIN